MLMEIIRALWGRIVPARREPTLKERLIKIHINSATP